MEATLRTLYPKLYIFENTKDDLKFVEEDDDGFIEYKRSLVTLDPIRKYEYATQMKWRIAENTKRQIAIYYIGVDDNGAIFGVAEDKLLEYINIFTEISESIAASIVLLEIIHIQEKVVLKFNVKLKQKPLLIA